MLRMSKSIMRDPGSSQENKYWFSHVYFPCCWELLSHWAVVTCLFHWIGSSMTKGAKPNSSLQPWCLVNVFIELVNKSIYPLLFIKTLRWGEENQCFCLYFGFFHRAFAPTLTCTEWKPRKSKLCLPWLLLVLSLLWTFISKSLTYFDIFIWSLSSDSFF